MRFVEKIGRNIDSATTDALIELGATTDEVTVEVLEKGSKGFLGFGAKNARVRVTVKEIVVEEPPVEVVPVHEEKVHVPEVQEEVQQTSPDEQHIADSAAAFLSKVLEEMGIEATLDTQVKSGKVCINIAGEKMGLVIGKRGETLDALQYLTNIAVNKSHDSYLKIILDTENYRKRREETLQKVAFKHAKKATQLKRPIVLEPMNPYDRRIIHSALQNSKSVRTHSEGREPFRKVVITPISVGRTNKR